jgi:hypothetical protein
MTVRRPRPINQARTGAGTKNPSPNRIRLKEAGACGPWPSKPKPWGRKTAGCVVATRRPAPSPLAFRPIGQPPLIGARLSRRSTADSNRSLLTARTLCCHRHRLRLVPCLDLNRSCFVLRASEPQNQGGISLNADALNNQSRNSLLLLAEVIP